MVTIITKEMEAALRKRYEIPESHRLTLVLGDQVHFDFCDSTIIVYMKEERATETHMALLSGAREHCFRTSPWPPIPSV